MERAQQRLATLEREKDTLLQGTPSPTAAQAAPRAPANKLVEDSLRNELQNQVSWWAGVQLVAVGRITPSNKACSAAPPS